MHATYLPGCGGGLISTRPRGVPEWQVKGFGCVFSVLMRMPLLACCRAGLVNFVLGQDDFAISGIPLTDQQHKMLAGQRCGRHRPKTLYFEPISAHPQAGKSTLCPVPCLHASDCPKTGSSSFRNGCALHAMCDERMGHRKASVPA